MSSKPASVREIAKAAGVSPTTAFRVLSGDGPVSDITRTRVLAAQALLNGQGNQSAPIQAEGRSVGIIMPTATAKDIGRHPTMFVTISNFISVLSGQGITNSVLVFDENNVTISNLLSEKHAGYLVIGTSEEQEKSIIPLLSGAALPAVMVNRQVDAPYISCVNIDDTSSCREATRYLISLGHRKIAFLGGQKNYQNTKRRMEGYAAAMRAANLEMPEEYRLTGDYSEASGTEMASRLLTLPTPPTAVVCASDTIAIGCVQAVNQAGLRVPEDVSVIGFGDIEASRTMEPALTTVAQYSQEFGNVAAHMLMQSMNMPVILSQKVLLKTSLLIRQSVLARSD